MRYAPQDEAYARTDDSRLGHELWSLQEDGNLRASRQLPLPRRSLTSPFNCLRSSPLL
jgi:hypothetical protein